MGDRQIVRDHAGKVVAAYCGEPLDEEGRAAMLGLVAAVWRYAAADESLGDRQAAARERIRARRVERARLRIRLSSLHASYRLRQIARRRRG